MAATCRATCTLSDAAESGETPGVRGVSADGKVAEKLAEYRSEAARGVDEVRAKLDHVFKMSERRLNDKTDKWVLYAWNSLKATARKGGTHTTYRGNHIDLNQDVCSVLVDDLILAWSCYRDYLIQKRIDT